MNAAAYAICRSLQEAEAEAGRCYMFEVSLSYVVCEPRSKSQPMHLSSIVLVGYNTWSWTLPFSTQIGSLILEMKVWNCSCRF